MQMTDDKLRLLATSMGTGLAVEQGVAAPAFVDSQIVPVMPRSNSLLDVQALGYMQELLSTRGQSDEVVDRQVDHVLGRPLQLTVMRRALKKLLTATSLDALYSGLKDLVGLVPRTISDDLAE